MDKKLKAKWVKALASGRYKQANGVLYDSGEKGFCCLGVLCRVSGASLEEIDDRTMPIKTDRFASVIDQHIAMKLASLNDEGVPFEVIAGLIHEAL